MNLQARIEVEDNDLVVTGSSDLHERQRRRFFQFVLGGKPIDTGWKIPLRGRKIQDVVVQVNNFLETEEYTVIRDRLVSKEVEFSIERQRSLNRAGDHAKSWKSGQSQISESQVANQLKSLGWRSERQLFPHQIRNVCHALAAINQANFSVPGSGKTVTALAIALIHLNARTIDTVLVVGPLASFLPWETESLAAVGTTFQPIRVRGSVLNRRGKYAEASRGDLLLVSYAAAANDCDNIKELCARLNVMLVVDESHRIKRFRGGVWAPALAEIAELTRVRMIMSGTPIPNGPLDLYSQLNVMWPNGLLTGTRLEYSSRVEKDFQDILQKIEPFTTRTAKSELGLRPYRVLRHDVQMTGTQAEIYQLIRHRFKEKVDSAGTWEDKIAALLRARPLRLLQAASNPDLLNHPDDEYRLQSITHTNPTLLERLVRFKDTDLPAKSAAAIDLVKEIVANGQKVVCWGNFIRNLDHFSRLLQSELGIEVFQVDGRVPASDDPTHEGLAENHPEDDSRERRIESFLNYEGPTALVTNPATSSESISLHRACHHAIYLDRTYDAALFLQSIDRIHRLGLPADTEVTIHIFQASILGDRSIDHLVDSSLLTKQQTMQMLLDGAEIHPLNSDDNSPDGDQVDLEQLLHYLIGEEVEEEI